MEHPAEDPPVPWAFVVVLLVVGIVLAVAIGYWGAIGHLGQPIPGTHAP